jgi:hypothetical protein
MNKTELEKMIDAGWVALEGNRYVITEAGRAALRTGIPGRTYGKMLPVDSVRARLKPPIRKKNKRRA